MLCTTSKPRGTAQRGPTYLLLISSLLSWRFHVTDHLIHLPCLSSKKSIALGLGKPANQRDRGHQISLIQLFMQTSQPSTSGRVPILADQINQKIKKPPPQVAQCTWPQPVCNRRTAQGNGMKLWLLRSSPYSRFYLSVIDFPSLQQCLQRDFQESVS